MTDWRPIPNYPGYEASDEGQVRGKRGHVLSKSADLSGRLRVAISAWPESKCRPRRVSRLVCLAFHGLPQEGKTCVLHKDGDLSNNRPDNLYWGSQKDNHDDSVRHGTAKSPPTFIGEEHHSAKLTADIVRSIRSSSASYRQLAREFGVDPSTIRQIALRRGWTHVE